MNKFENEIIELVLKKLSYTEPTLISALNEYSATSKDFSVLMTALISNKQSYLLECIDDAFISLCRLDNMKQWKKLFFNSLFIFQCKKPLIYLLENAEHFKIQDLEITKIISFLIHHPEKQKAAIHYTQKYIYRVDIDSYFRNMLFEVYMSLEKKFDEDLLGKFYLLVKELHETGIMNTEELAENNILIDLNGNYIDPQLDLLKYKHELKNF